MRLSDRRAQLIDLLTRTVGMQKAAEREAKRQREVAAELRGAIQIIDEQLREGPPADTTEVPNA